MTTETLVILLTFILALVHYLLPAILEIGRYGVTAFVGPRDEFDDKGSIVSQRAKRANNNFRETVPWAIGLLILVQFSGGANATSALWAWIYLISRIAYLPLYLLGVPYARSLVWTASIVALCVIALQVA